MINLRTLFLTLAPLILTPIAHSASILISPIDPVIEGNQNSTSLWLENKDSRPVYMEIKAVRWEQQNGESVYVKQSDIVISPPFALISPGKRQLIRLMKNQAVPQGQEHAYRIIIDEVPQAAGNAGEPTIGINFQMRYSVPLFVNGAGLTSRQDAVNKDTVLARPALSYRVTQGKNGSQLEVTNTGTVHARLSGLSSTAGSSVIEGLVGYVLPHATMSFPLPKEKSRQRFPTGDSK